MRPSAAVIILSLVGAVLCWAAPAVSYELPPSDTGLGFYYVVDHFGVIEQPKAFADMAAAGCNTLTVYYRDGGNIVQQIDPAIEAGLLAPGQAVMLLRNAAIGPSEALAQAKTLTKHLDVWPEFIFYGPDEPMPGPEGRNNPGLIEHQREAHDAGLRWGTALSDWDAPWIFGPLVEVAIVHMGAYTPALAMWRKSMGLETWAYCSSPMATNALMVRYHTGLWRWKYRPSVFLAWAFHSYENEVGLAAWGEGAIDYRVLRALEVALIEKVDVNPIEAGHAAQWLESLRNSIECNPWAQAAARPARYTDRGAYTFFRDTVPRPANFDSIRQQAVYYLDALTGCGLELDLETIP